MEKRNSAVDILKLILMVMVVIGHLMPMKFEYSYQTTIALLYHSLARTIVPLFFIISGYYFRNKLYEISKFKAVLKRYLILFVVWQIIYYPLLHKFYRNDLFTLKEYLYSLFYGFGHLWYLNASILGVLLLYLIRKQSFKFKLIIAIALILSGYTYQFYFEKGWLNEEGLEIYNLLGTSRNFLFYGFPYLLLGTQVDQMKFKTSTIGLFVLIGLNITELYTCKAYGIAYSNIFLSAIPLSVYTFKFALASKSELNIKINSKMLLGVYLIHFYPIFYVVTNYKDITFEAIMLKIVIVFTSSIISFFILNKLDQKFKILF